MLLLLKGGDAMLVNLHGELKLAFVEVVVTLESFEDVVEVFFLLGEFCAVFLS